MTEYHETYNYAAEEIGTRLSLPTTEYMDATLDRVADGEGGGCRAK